MNKAGCEKLVIVKNNSGSCNVTIRYDNCEFRNAYQALFWYIENDLCNGEIGTKLSATFDSKDIMDDFKRCLEPTRNEVFQLIFHSDLEKDGTVNRYYSLPSANHSIVKLNLQDKVEPYTVSAEKVDPTKFFRSMTMSEVGLEHQVGYGQLGYFEEFNSRVKELEKFSEQDKAPNTPQSELPDDCVTLLNELADMLDIEGEPQE